jgi:hypothetical protein
MLRETHGVCLWVNGEVEYTDGFGEWWLGLDDSAQASITAYVELLEDHGPNLDYPYPSDITGSKYGNMRELRVQSKGRPFRVFYAFDPRRCAILLIGDDKTGKSKFYEQMIPLADRLYTEHLQDIG